MHSLICIQGFAGDWLKYYKDGSIHFSKNCLDYSHINSLDRFTSGESHDSSFNEQTCSVFGTCNCPFIYIAHQLSLPKHMQIKEKHNGHC